jgi:hypothetical protein
MMNELAQTGIFFSGSTGGKGATSAKKAPGLRAKEPMRSGEGSFLAVFRKTCQRQKNVPGRIRSREPGGEERPKPRADRDEGEAAGVFTPAWFLFGDTPGQASADGTGSVDGSRLAGEEYESANPLENGPVPAGVWFTGEGFPGLPGMNTEAETPGAAGLWTEQALATPAQLIPGVTGETEPAPEGNSRLAVASGTTVPVTEEQAHEIAAGAGLTGVPGNESLEASWISLEQNVPAAPGSTGSPAGSGNPEAGSGAFVRARADQAAATAAPEEVRTGPADGRRGRESDPHLPAGEKMRTGATPAFLGEQLIVEDEEQGALFSVPGKEHARARMTADDSKKEKLEVLAAGRLPVEPARADVLPAVEEGNQGERWPLAEKVMNQILQGARLMVKSGVAHMHLELHPPELGRLRLALVVEGEMVTARFTAESQTVRAIIETNLPELRSALQESGLQVDQLQVEVETGDGSQSGAFGQFLPEDSSPGPERRERDGLEMAFFSETGDEESIREEAAWLGRINLRV